MALAEMNNAELAGADLNRSSLRGAQLRSVLLVRAQLNNAVLNTVKLNNANLRSGWPHRRSLSQLDRLGTSPQSLTTFGVMILTPSY